MICSICKQDLVLQLTDHPHYMVCDVCNVPYHKGSRTLPFSEEYVKILMHYKRYLDEVSPKTINICPDAFTLRGSANDVTSEEDRELWNAWFAENKHLFADPELLISADKNNFNITRMDHGKKEEGST